MDRHRTYGRWHKWDGKPLAKKPLFYQGVDAETAEVLNGISEDITKICGALKKLEPNFDTSQVKTIMEWYMASYSSSISDASNLKSAMNTNSAYEGLCHPMKEEQGGYVPDFQFRYLSEDVPTGYLIVLLVIVFIDYCGSPFHYYGWLSFSL